MGLDWYSKVYTNLVLTLSYRSQQKATNTSI